MAKVKVKGLAMPANTYFGYTFQRDEWLEIKDEKDLDLFRSRPDLFEIDEGVKKPKKKIESSVSKMIDNYLGQNAKVVIRQLEKDAFDKPVLKELLAEEKKGKKRAKIIAKLKELIGE